MSKLTLPELAKEIAGIDFAMLLTRAEGGEIAGRPMSNNGEVEYDGDSYYFTWTDSKMVADIRRDPKVALSLQGRSSLFGSPPLMIAVEGEAELIQDKAAFAERWHKQLDRWFQQGIDTPGMTMIKVQAKRIAYWQGEDEGEFTP